MKQDGGGEVQYIDRDISQKTIHNKRGSSELL